MIVFYNDVQKSRVPEGILRLRRLLQQKQPQFARLLVRFWDNQQAAITYAELRNALLMGAIDEKTVEAWFGDYSRFITEQMLPMWEEAIANAAQQVEVRRDGFLFDAGDAAVKQWTQSHTAELVTQLSGDQRTALNAVIKRAISLPDMPVDELARAIRPLVGLTQPQAVANFKYYTSIRKNLLKNHPNMKPETAAKRAAESALKYAGKQHRLRAETIAITELTTAHNMGELISVQQAYNGGYMGRSAKRWIDSGDDRVCDECKRLNGTEADLQEPFITKYGAKDAPPCHPRCACSFEVIEKEPPVQVKR